MAKMIKYIDNLENIGEENIKGFFKGWKIPYSPQKHLQILENSDYFILAVDETNNKVVGFITAISDKVSCAFIPLLEVLPEHQKKGIGSKLVINLLGKLKHITNIDLTCDPPLQKFYSKLGFIPSSGMVIRKYLPVKE